MAEFYKRKTAKVTVAHQEMNTKQDIPMVVLLLLVI